MSDSKRSATFIQDMPDEPRERLRREIFESLGTRETEANEAFKGLLTFCGIVYSGGTIAILGYIGAKTAAGVPLAAVASFFCFVAALMSFAVFYQRHSQLHAARRMHFAQTAQQFFLRQAPFEDVMDAQRYGASLWLYRLIFWVPFGFAVAGFVLGATAALGFGPTISKP